MMYSETIRRVWRSKMWVEHFTSPGNHQQNEFLDFYKVNGGSNGRPKNGVYRAQKPEKTRKSGF